MKCFLGLDNGGTTTKAALFSTDGTELGSASVDTRMLTPRPGFCERDMDEMWAANCTVIRSVLQKTGVDPADVAGVAVCGHGKGLYLWGKDNRPLRHGIISTDNRAWEYPLHWHADGTAAKVFAISNQSILACQPVALLAWLRDHEPGVLDQVQWIFAAKDYVRFRLTGEARAELTDYSGANLVNLQTRQYDDRLLDCFGLTPLRTALPPLCRASDLCGTVTAEAAARTGLLAGTPVAGGMFDIDACALALDVVDERHVCMIAGTWSINEYVRRTPVLDGSVLMNSLFCLPEYYLVEECSPTSAGNNEWFIRTLLPELAEHEKTAGGSVYDVMNAWVDGLPADEPCPVFLPFLMASNVHPNARASFVGLSSYHTRAHLVRSVYEGIVFSHRQHLDRLLASRRDLPDGGRPASIRLAGGVTHSPVWIQMFADVLQLPVETVAVHESGALGCAIAAAVAVGEYASLAEAAGRMCTVARPVLPDPAKAAVYDRKYALYRRVIDGLDGVWGDFQALIDRRT